MWQETKETTMSLPFVGVTDFMLHRSMFKHSYIGVDVQTVLNQRCSTTNYFAHFSFLNVAVPLLRILPFVWSRVLSTT